VHKHPSSPYGSSKKEKPQKIESQKLVSVSGQCSSTPVGTDLASTNFCLFLRLKSALEGWRFCDTTDINKNAMEQLKRLSQNCFYKCFQRLYSRWQCIFAQRDYFEANVN
jgi:hypothetical protein